MLLIPKTLLILAKPSSEAGVKMLHNIEKEFLNDLNMDPLDKTLMAFASYNSGPNRIAKLREQARAEGLAPNK